MSSVVEWTEGVQYETGTIVVHQGAIYRATQPHTSQQGMHPAAAVQFWVVENVTALAEAPVTWVGTTGNAIPANAIQGGEEADGQPLYIARGWIEVSRNWWDGARISYGGKEITVRDYEILIGSLSAIRWVPARGPLRVENFQETFIEGGREASGEPLFVARAKIVPRGESRPGVHPGKAGPGLTCHVAYGGEERMFEQYEVLVLNRAQ
nr:hypothetical protein HK105_004281 [Polyrhizophydium stewartii]